ncbi:MAG: hypothetical protein OXT70_01260 [Chloroflexota bacterium]|nr:hypothetical protein [Chloroflexota bacterium]
MAKCEALARMLSLSTADGREYGLMDHQRLILRLLTEHDPSSGMPRHAEVDALGPRQWGKTTTQFIATMERMLLRDRPQRCVYSSQSHNAGLKKMKEDWIPLLKQSGLVASAKFDWSLNTMLAEIRTGSGSYMRVVAGGAENSDRGITSLDFATIDEALADRDDRKEQVLLPAMLTVADSQLFLASTPGNLLSLYLIHKRARALEALADPEASTAVVEFTADMDADPYEREVWHTANPALGQTIPIRSYQRLAESLKESTFRREALGQWVPDDDMPGGIPEEEWAAARDRNAESMMHSSTPGKTLGIDCTPDQARMTACVADGAQVEFAGSTDDLSDVAGWVARLLVETGARRVAVQANWALSHKTGSIRELPGIDVRELGRVEWMQACGITLSAFIERDIAVRQSAALDDANACAIRQPRESRWVWNRGRPDGDISPLVAMTCAVAGSRMDIWGHQPAARRL